MKAIKTKQQNDYVVTYVDSKDKQYSFKTSKVMLQCHQLLMKNNPFIKSFEIKTTYY